MGGTMKCCEVYLKGNLCRSWVSSQHAVDSCAGHHIARSWKSPMHAPFMTVECHKSLWPLRPDSINRTPSLIRADVQDCKKHHVLPLSDPGRKQHSEKGKVQCVMHPFTHMVGFEACNKMAQKSTVYKEVSTCAQGTRLPTRGQRLLCLKMASDSL